MPLEKFTLNNDHAVQISQQKCPRTTKKQARNMVSIKITFVIAFTALIILSAKNIQAHLQSSHPNGDQCQCAQIDESWHFHFLQKTSKHKTQKRGDFNLLSDADCNEKRHQRLKWDVFICP